MQDTALSYREIARRTGASASTVARHARRRGWLRPDATLPEEPYTPEGRRKLRRGEIPEALLRRAEHLAFDTEMNPAASRAQIERAMRLLRLSREIDEEERLSRLSRKSRRKPGSTRRSRPKCRAEAGLEERLRREDAPLPPSG